jgi:lipoprotein NlpI
MRATWIAWACLAVLNLAPLAHAQAGDASFKDILKLLSQRKAAEALSRVEKLLAKDGKNARALLMRGVAHDLLEKYPEAVADFTKAIDLEGVKMPEAFDLRGVTHFKQGDMVKALADFDRYLELRPDVRPYHWKRGICCYYAGKYAEGNKQFEDHQKVNHNDVENAVWRYICQAHLIGRDKARAQMLQIKNDERIPMMMIYDLFLAKAKPEDVFKAARAKATSEAEKKLQLFYAHLYLGLYYESQGDAKQARDHIDLAAGEYRVRDYMGDVARVHRDLLRKKDEAK